jgi:hypothetical protein
MVNGSDASRLVPASRRTQFSAAAYSTAGSRTTAHGKIFVFGRFAALPIATVPLAPYTPLS